VILQGESEGIVRREAAALLKEIYEHHKFLWVDVHLYLTRDKTSGFKKLNFEMSHLHEAKPRLIYPVWYLTSFIPASPDSSSGGLIW
jgi:hypothetical protein